MSLQSNSDPFGAVMPGVHEAVRKSALLVELHEKLSSLPPGSFPFAAEFVGLRDVIAPQIGDTRVLFPEFTPHDEPLHVAPLFQLADKLFASRYRAMNASELFLLASALYAHDWGMAVGQDEKNYLRNGAAPELLRDTFTPLADEKDRLEAFILSEGLDSGSSGASPELDDYYLRLYVRQTHARRSGARARAHFEKYPAVGEALAHLCEGHWHDFATLDDAERFPREHEVAGHTAHILALALQVRLTDLFHITDDRTPFALWRFVSPRDKRSSEEWKKHRALHGVAVVDYTPGRAIKVQGSTENEEVWAGLQDLRRYCEDQIRGALDISARHVPQRYGLDILQLQWSVTTGQLRPVDFRFEFDRAAMFRILSDDIYDGDCYVFLRELLQNSIDAVRTRRQRHLRLAEAGMRRKPEALPFDTTIYFDVEHKDNGDIVVACRDFGVGMDEHIIRNYFTVAGVSYYRSAEFERQHLGFEPISRFGIGILSCFMVADKLRVKTYRDPECGPPMAHADLQLPGAEEHRPRRLSLEAPGVERQFIVRELTDNFKVGTQVTVEVLAQKVRKGQSKAPQLAGKKPADESAPGVFRRLLEISEYLCDIAGFVESPIVVQENWPGLKEPKVTLILHPDRDARTELAQYPGKPQVHQLSREYPWDEVFEAQQVEPARKALTTRCIELRELLGAEGYEGWFVFVKPTNEGWDFGGREGFWSASREQISWRDRATGEPSAPPVRWRERDRRDNRPKRSRRIFGVYRDGILLPGIETFDELEWFTTLPWPLIRINLPGARAPEVTVARKSLKDKRSAWEKGIWSAVAARITEDIPKTLALPPSERLFRLGWLASVYGLRFEILKLKALIPDSKVASVWVLPNDGAQLREGIPPVGTEVPLAPTELSCVSRELIMAHAFSGALGPKCEARWDGPASLVVSLEFLDSVPFGEGLRLNSSILESRLATNRLQFLQPPSGIGVLIPQPVATILAPEPTREEPTDQDKASDRDWTRRMEALRDRDVNDALVVAGSEPQSLSAKQRGLLLNVLAVGSGKFGLPVPFSRPFSQCWGTRDGYINALHPIGRTVLRCLAACAVAERDKAVDRTLYDRIRNLSVRSALSMREEAQSRGGLRAFLTELFNLIRERNVIASFVAPELPDERDLVPAMVEGARVPGRRMPWLDEFLLENTAGGCGKLVTEWPLGAATAGSPPAT